MRGSWVARRSLKGRMKDEWCDLKYAERRLIEGGLSSLRVKGGRKMIGLQQ